MWPWQRPEVQVTKWDNYNELKGPFGETKITGKRSDLVYRGNDREIKQTLQKLQHQNSLPSSSSSETPEWVAPAVTGAAFLAGIFLGSDISS